LEKWAQKKGSQSEKKNLGNPVNPEKGTAKTGETPLNPLKENHQPGLILGQPNLLLLGFNPQFGQPFKSVRISNHLEEWEPPPLSSKGQDQRNSQ